MTTPPSSDIDTQNNDNLAQIRSQLATLENVLVSLSGVEGNSRLANLVQRGLTGLEESTLTANNPEVAPVRRVRGSRKRSSFSNSLLRLSQRQIMSQLSSAMRRAIARDL